MARAVLLALVALSRGDCEAELSLRQLRATQLTNGTACGGLEDPCNADCAESVLWAYEKGLKLHPDWYFVPLGKISEVKPSNAKLEDLQRVFFCGRAGDTAPRCGVPPCGCSRPPCGACEALEVAPKLKKAFKLMKRFDFSGPVQKEFDVVQIADQNLTHSCSDYVNDGTTAFTSKGQLHVKVSGVCPDGRCLKSGRIMSRDAFTHGVFTFSAKLPKCNSVWPALWLLPESSKGDGKYGPWPCSGEIDVLETVNDDPYGAFNLVAGFGSTNGCFDASQITCNACAPPSYCTSTTLADAKASHLMVEEVDCAAGQRSWKEHLFVLLWQREQISAFVDPKLSYNAQGHLVDIQDRGGGATVKTYSRHSTPTWTAVQDYMEKCFQGRHSPDAPFDIPMKIVLNIAVGGYGGAPCSWGQESCSSLCGGAVGAEISVSDISVWQ